VSGVVTRTGADPPSWLWHEIGVGPPCREGSSFSDAPPPQTWRSHWSTTTRPPLARSASCFAAKPLLQPLAMRSAGPPPVRTALMDLRVRRCSPSPCPANEAPVAQRLSGASAKRRIQGARREVGGLSRASMSAGTGSKLGSAIWAMRWAASAWSLVLVFWLWRLSRWKAVSASTR